MFERNDLEVTDAPISRLRIVAAGVVSFWLTLVVLLTAGISIVEAAPVTVDLRVARTKVQFGNQVRASVKLMWTSVQARDGAVLLVEQAQFPYRKFVKVAERQDPDHLTWFQLSPKINSRIQATVVLANGGRIHSSRQQVFIDPIQRGNRFTRTRIGMRYSGAAETYSDLLMRRWLLVPRRFRTIYFYSDCSGSRWFKLRSKKIASQRLRGGRMTLVFPGYQFRDSDCRNRRYGSLAIGTSKLAGYLGNGDDGGGVPNISVPRYRLWQRVAGKKRLSRQTVKRLGFG